MFEDTYSKKRVLVTGHTGFKGSWLTFWLLELGADVCGYSLDVPSSPANFDILGLDGRLTHVTGDIRDREKLKGIVDDFKPEVVFHLAAQALVRRSFENPVETIETNALGTLNVLECIRRQPSVQAAVIITSDKCYRNVEWTWGYRENDPLGGEDPYSASKGCAELLVYSYVHTFFRNGPRVASTRAGNVIGGGDWAEDRIVPDAIRAWSRNQPLMVRHPEATRPWQHVLEPLSGYLWLGARLWKDDPQTAGQAFNFGPDARINGSVGDLLAHMAGRWAGAEWVRSSPESGAGKEATLLKLCCDKSLNQLGWHAVLSFEDTVEMTVDWYRRYFENGPAGMPEWTLAQLGRYVKRAEKERQPWVK